MKPGAEQQIQFLQHLQQLFEDGDFVATFKYALLMTFYRLPRAHHEHLKSTNILERLNEGIKRRTRS
jgi:hypothetical protein